MGTSKQTARGSKLFSELTAEAPAPRMIKAKGRSKELLDRRNEKIFYRYYYYARIHKCRYDVVLEYLVNEFYLSRVTLGELFAGSADKVRQINAAAPSINQLRNRHPETDWTGRNIKK